MFFLQYKTTIFPTFDGSIGLFLPSVSSAIRDLEASRPQFYTRKPT